ncbi:SdrD B-like domain-containing protein [Opitutus terrae]|uniref:SD-repeat containing protein B domain-containing protein n=1 Tax=Opitutus terrae (strain DSM 11246 / JCM 15787 / PB90-1) TaxID=452637 RepID=B1ZW00_OPITP|nr:SdrD B-like domain-containing protein [Opitutus terrae]ACB76016.1 hypothetical protein Oter_2735 [Opitutus terrae PB90-1]
MNLPRLLASCRFARFAWPLVIAIAFVAVPVHGQDDDPAGTPSYVVYTPDEVMPVQGPAPLQFSYQLTITSPTGMPANTNATVTVVGEATLAPAAVPLATASGFVTFSAATLEFSGPQQSKTITVQLRIPSGTVEGQFSFHISTTGWPSGHAIRDNGTDVNMTVTLPLPVTAPLVTIESPAPNATYNYVAGGSPTLVPVTVKAVAAANTTVQQVAAWVRAVNDAGVEFLSEALNLSVSGTGMSQATGTLSYPVTEPGTYTISATAKDNLDGAATDSLAFIVTRTVPPPTVVISQPNQTSFDYHLGGPALSIPFAFEARSQFGGIKSIAVTLDGQSVPFSAPALGALVVTGTGTLTIAAGGDYELVVTAKDDYGTAVATTSFVVNAISDTNERPVRGVVFFDVNANGVMDGDDYGLPGMKVRLVNLWGHTAKTTTSADGEYVFNAKPGVYVVWVDCVDGFAPTTLIAHPVVVYQSAVDVADTGFKLSFLDLMGMRAEGKSHGFWKNNVDKAISGKKGAQVPAASVRAYTTQLGDLALSPFDALTMPAALTTLSSSSSKPKALLAKQLLAAEYNYANGAYIDDNAALTYAFIYWGEHVMKNADSLSRVYVLWAKDWFDAYNNSEGGRIRGSLL